MLPKGPLVDCHWLNSHLNDENLIILDASMTKVVGKDPVIYEQFCCIPKTQLCDIDSAFHNASSTQPHTMPPINQFNEQLVKLGITTSSIVVIYDNQGIYSAPRAWWMFKALGIEAVYVLDGGLPQWLANDYPVAPTYSQHELALNSDKVFATSYQTNTVVETKDVLSAITKDNICIIDARAPERFMGLAPEPRAGLRSGHIPSSLNQHFSQLIDGFCFKQTKQLKTLFDEHGINNEQRLIFTCGSGITACIVLLAAYIIGFRKLSLYDGSWSEWGSNFELPIEGKQRDS